jgi:hypothetical protein
MSGNNKKNNKTDTSATGSGFQVNPENINRNGRPKGTGWKQTLNRLLDGSHIHIEITNENGRKTVIDRRVDENSESLRQSIAAGIIVKALSGDLRASQIIMDRIEGKPAQKIDIVETKDELSEKLQKYIDTVVTDGKSI